MRMIDLVHYLDEYLNVARTPDRSNNGLQVQGNDEVTRVAFAVDACLASFEAALAERAQLLVVHHGLFWSEHVQITGPHYQRIKTLICGGCGLYAAHIPLDAHPVVGNNIELARLIGLQDVQPWGDYKGIKLGVIGNLPRPLPVSELNARLEEKIGTGNRVHIPTNVFTPNPLTQPHGAERPAGRSAPGRSASPPRGEGLAQRVAICSGFGVTLLDEAVAAGADTLLTGETSHQWFHPVEERSVNVIYGGHYNTETVGLKALARHIKDTFDLQTVFIDLPTGL